ncbi:MAG: hypothetical protein ACFUZC_07465 [Chthoniobacteraceae bacterium]
MRILDEVRVAYERGEGSLRDLAGRYGLPYSTLTRRCRSDEWRAPRSRRGVAQMSVNAYAYIQGAWLPRQQLEAIEWRVHVICRMRDIRRGLKDDSRFGTVFIYPVDVIAEVFSNRGLFTPVDGLTE